MKKCDYCGRPNQDTAVSCYECGTELSAPAPLPAARPVRSKPLPRPVPLTVQPHVPSTPQLLDLENLPNAFTFEEGFSRPDWKVIAAALKEKVEKSELGRAYDEVALQWLTKLASELGGDYHVMRSPSFALVSAVKQ